jgi:hypothetical protein
MLCTKTDVFDLFVVLRASADQSTVNRADLECSKPGLETDCVSLTSHYAHRW